MAVEATPKVLAVPRELAAGIDTVILSLRGIASDELLCELDEAKELARASKAPVEYVLGSETFLVWPGGLSRHTFKLKHQNGVMGIGAGLNLPVAKFQPSAEYLHGVGAYGANDWFKDVVRSQIEITGEIVSRVDLHADFCDLDLQEREIDNFVSRATSVSTHSESRMFTGVRFGRRSSRAALARIYDKTEEIATKGGSYWFDIWGSSYVPGDTVWRTEFELHRGFLRKFGIGSLDEVVSSLGALWTYLTTEWLRLLTPTEDRTRSRWPVDPRWLAVTNASLATHRVGLDRVSAQQTRDSVSHELPYLLGEVIRWAAIVDATSVEEALESMPRYLHRRLEEKGWDFASRQARKRIELGLVS